MKLFVEKKEARQGEMITNYLFEIVSMLPAFLSPGMYPELTYITG